MPLPRPCAGTTRRVRDAPRRPYLLGCAGVWGEGCLLPRPFCYAPCGVAGALPHPVTLSAVKFANRPCARLAEALRGAEGGAFGGCAGERSTATPARSIATPARSTTTLGRSTATLGRSTATLGRSTTTLGRSTATPLHY